MTSLRNAVWQVTDFGLETTSHDGGPYRIPGHALLEVDRESFVSVYRRLTVIAGTNANFEDFLKAWSDAVRKHCGPDVIDYRILQVSVKEARLIAERIRQASKSEAEMAWADLPEPEPGPQFREVPARSYPSVEAPEILSEEAPEQRKR